MWTKSNKPLCNHSYSWSFRVLLLLFHTHKLIYLIIRQNRTVRWFMLLITKKNDTEWNFFVYNEGLQKHLSFKFVSVRVCCFYVMSSTFHCWISTSNRVTFKPNVEGELRIVHSIVKKTMFKVLFFCLIVKNERKVTKSWIDLLVEVKHLSNHTKIKSKKLWAISIYQKTAESPLEKKNNLKKNYEEECG